MSLAFSSVSHLLLSIGLPLRDVIYPMRLWWREVIFHLLVTINWRLIGDCFWIKTGKLVYTSTFKARTQLCDRDMYRVCTRCYNVCEFILCQTSGVWKALFLRFLVYPLALVNFLPFIPEVP